MTANSKSNTLAIKPKTKGIQKKKELINKIQKPNSKNIAKVLPENNVTDIQLTPQLKQNIVNIAQAAPGLMEMLEWYHKKHKNVIEIPELKINNKLLGSVVITKTFKISEKAIKKFIEFAEKQPHLKHQDLMGMALIEFVESKEIQLFKNPNTFKAFEEILNMKSKMAEVIDWYEKKQKNVIEIPELKINARALHGKLVLKTYKLYETAIKKITDFIEKHPQYKQQDIISQALIEFAEKYH